jgi:hypothetical protein
MRMYDSLKRTHHILSLSMISFTHITYSVWVPNDGLPSFDDRLSVFDLYPLTSSLSSFFFFFLNWRTSFQREWVFEAHSHRFVTDFGSKARDRESPY